MKREYYRMNRNYRIERYFHQFLKIELKITYPIFQQYISHDRFFF